ncbi:MAG: hypothetical protein HOE90_02150 [Bacteriovoracaceae bacterium]|jgi:hypothetical protein|nr:hypothetical protein [Bacteriovoracaceae bacterium]
MKHILFLSLLFSSIASASYLENCVYKTTLVSEGRVGSLDKSLREGEMPRAYIFKIDKVVENKGSHAGCDHLLGNLKALTSTKNTGAKVGDSVYLDHFYVNNYSPNGVVESDRWKVVAAPVVQNECFKVSDKDGKPAYAVLGLKPYNVDQVCVTDQWKNEEFAAVEIQFKLAGKVLVEFKGSSEKYSDSNVRFTLNDGGFEPTQFEASIKDGKLVDFKLPSSFGL